MFVTVLSRFINTNQRSTVFTSKQLLTQHNSFLAHEFRVIVIILIFIIIITRFFIVFDNIEDNVLVASSKHVGYQKSMPEPANKRQLIATLQLIRMHNVTRYQHFSRPSKQLNQNAGQQSRWPYSDLPNTNLSQRVDFKIAPLDKPKKTGSTWNSVNDRHSNGSEPFAPPTTTVEPVKYGW